MEYHDRVLKCVDCGGEFVFTAGEQQFYADKGFKNEPKRCKGCKSRRGSGERGASGGGDRGDRGDRGGYGGGGGGGGGQRSETKTTCSQCGKETTVPFRPTQGRPVFCRECFQQRRSMA